MHIKDRTFVVSGGASGLGLATVKFLHAHGASTAILDLNEDAGNSLVQTLSTASSTSSEGEGGKEGRARFFQVDVSDSESVAEAVKGVLAWVGETGRLIGGVVAAAGVGNPGKIIDRSGEPLSLESFDFVLNINLRGTIDLIRQFLPAITQNKPTEPDGERGVLILVSSVAAEDGQTGQLSYSASKGAINGLLLPLTRDLAPYGVRAVSIMPGVFESQMTSMMSNKVRKGLEGVQEFPKRMGKAEEFASLVAEVVRNPMLNGVHIRLDGGIRMPSKI